MSKIPLNERTVTVRLKRRDLCDLMSACTVLSEYCDSNRWEELHNQLKAIIEDFDHKQEWLKSITESAQKYAVDVSSIDGKR